MFGTNRERFSSCPVSHPGLPLELGLQLQEEVSPLRCLWLAWHERWGGMAPHMWGQQKWIPLLASHAHPIVENSRYSSGHHSARFLALLPPGVGSGPGCLRGSASLQNELLWWTVFEWPTGSCICKVHWVDRWKEEDNWHRHVVEA